LGAAAMLAIVRTSGDEVFQLNACFGYDSAEISAVAHSVLDINDQDIN
jgi:hypothetical protein